MFPVRAIGPIPKPSRLTRDVAKHQRGIARDKAKRVEDRAADLAWEQQARACYDRDLGCSRISGRALKFRSGTPLTIADPHHIQFRSAQGSDELFNLLTVSRSEHDRLHHRGAYKTWLEVSGDANQTITIRETDAETGALVREWLSPCPR